MSCCVGWMTFVVWPTEPGSSNTQTKAPSHPPDSSCLHLMLGLLCVRELLQGLANYVKSLAQLRLANYERRSEPDNVTVRRFGLHCVSSLLLSAGRFVRRSGLCEIGGEGDRWSCEVTVDGPPVDIGKRLTRTPLDFRRMQRSQLFTISRLPTKMGMWGGIAACILEPPGLQ